MDGSVLTNFSFWWIIPILMMILCFFMMKGRRGSMMCGFGSRGIDNQETRAQDSAIDILKKRYASGDIDKEEYEQRRKTLTGAHPEMKQGH